MGKLLCIHTVFKQYMMYSFVHVIRKNTTVHAASLVNIKTKSDQDFDASHDDLYDDIDMSIWNDVKVSAITHNGCVDPGIKQVFGEGQLNIKIMLKIRMMFLPL